MRLLITSVLSVALMGAAFAQEYDFEKLGVPTLVKGHSLTAVTEHPDGYWIAWDSHETPDFMGLIGVRLDTGEHFTVDLSQWGQSHVSLTTGPDQRVIYAFCGRPNPHFVRYDPAAGEITDLGSPDEAGYYFSGGAKAPDGRFYVGTYPYASLVWVDTNTGEIGSAGRLTDSERNKYAFPSVAVSDDNIVYVPIGLHHQELFAYDPSTGEATEILPEELNELSHSPRVWRAADGNVYGRSTGTSYLCTPTGIVTDCEILSEAEHRPVVDGWRLLGIDQEGVLTMQRVGAEETKTLQTDYYGRPVMIYCVATEWDGKIWGGNGFPARVFSYDAETGEMVDHGKQTGGGIQVYDIIGTPEGLLLGGYTGGTINFWNPNAPEGEQDNWGLARGENQERPIHWTPGPDGNYYIGTRPIKGHVGGGLCRVTLDGGDAPAEATWWIDPIGAQSVTGCAAVPETGELLCATSNYGGSSSIPTEPEGHIFMWDCANEKVVEIDEPIPGARSYSAPVRAENGLVYMFASTDDGRRYLAYDPVKRETVFTGETGFQTVHFPLLHDSPVGPEGLLIGLGDDAVFAIDPVDHSVRVLARDPSISDAHGFMVSDDGVLYYGSGAELWRCDLLP